MNDNNKEKFVNQDNYNYEQELLQNLNKLPFMNNLLSYNQFSEDFLIKTRIYYDSWKCLRTQNNLSPYFCFKYLYDRPEYDSADDWTDYNQVYNYLQNKNYTYDFIQKEYNRAMEERV